MTADVGDKGKGFIVDTAQAQVAELGTKFGEDVVVFQGEVELFDRTSKPPQTAPMTRLVEVRPCVWMRDGNSDAS